MRRRLPRCSRRCSETDDPGTPSKRPSISHRRPSILSAQVWSCLSMCTRCLAHACRLPSSSDNGPCSLGVEGFRSIKRRADRSRMRSEKRDCFREFGADGGRYRTHVFESSTFFTTSRRREGAARKPSTPSEQGLGTGPEADTHLARRRRRTSMHTPLPERRTYVFGGGY